MDSQTLLKRFLFLIDEDTQAFNNVIDSNRLSAESDNEKQHKLKAIEGANKYAATVFLKLQNYVCR